MNPDLQNKARSPSLLLRAWRQTWFVWARRLLAVMTLAFVAIFGFLMVKYPGFVEDTWFKFRHTPLAEFVEECKFLDYFCEYSGKLRLNPATGMYDFEDAALQTEGSTLDQGILAYHAGRFGNAVEQIEAHIKEGGENEKSLYWLALSHQRVAELGNCAVHCRKGTSEHYCSLPLLQQHEHPDASRKAIEIFAKLLDDYDPKNRTYRWLLNFSYMTLGEFPDNVPPKYLIQGDFIDTKRPNPRGCDMQT